jgi:hypothetical protein
VSSRQLHAWGTEADLRDLLGAATERAAVLLAQVAEPGSEVRALPLDDAMQRGSIAIVKAEHLQRIAELAHDTTQRRVIHPNAVPALTVLRQRRGDPAQYLRLQYFARVWDGESWAAQPESFVRFGESYFRWIKRWAGPPENRDYIAPAARELKR